MKINLHGIRTRMFIMYVLFAVGIVATLGVLQVSLIRPYYRENKTKVVQKVSDHIEKYILNGVTTEQSASRVFQTIVDNNVCVTLYNDHDKRIYEADSLGSGCVFNAMENDIVDAPVNLLSGAALRQELINHGGEAGFHFFNQRTQQEMLVYGRAIKGELGNYYLYVNTPLEPIDSIVRFFARQYLLFTGLVIVIAVFLAVLLSDSISKPIIKMRNEADKLSHADYSAQFDGGEYTETQELAATLNDAKDKLSKIDELRRDLIANVSHDIKTPLTSIRAYAEMIRDLSGDVPEKRNDHLNVIIDESDYLNHLVADMSELSKMQSGNYVLKKRNFDLREKIEDVVSLFAPMIEEGNLAVLTDCEKDMTVYADEIKIAQVLNNYLSNAIKHSPKGKTIRIGTKRIHEETVRVEVTDEGEGISKEELPYIWDRYQKSSRSFSRSMTNTGLGLSIVKAILDCHHARYGVVSKEGCGSTFWFELDQPSGENTEYEL